MGSSEPRFDAIGIVVSDMARALNFYRMLGLEFPDGAQSEAHVEVVLTGGLRLMFDTEDLVRSFDKSFKPPESGGRIGFAFACESSAAVDAMHGEIVAAGHASHLAPFDAFWGQRYATVVDPDGNLVDLFAVL